MMAMAHTPLPHALQRFLTDCIDSVEQLEIIAVMHGTTHWWTARELAQELYLSPSLTTRDLETLASRGLLDVRPGNDVSYRVSAVSPAQAQAMRGLMDIYRARRVEILGYIITGKGRALRQFAEAFRFRKDR